MCHKANINSFIHYCVSYICSVSMTTLSTIMFNTRKMCSAKLNTLELTALKTIIAAWAFSYAVPASNLKLKLTMNSFRAGCKSHLFKLAYDH